MKNQKEKLQVGDMVSVTRRVGIDKKKEWIQYYLITGVAEEQRQPRSFIEVNFEVIGGANPMDYYYKQSASRGILGYGVYVGYIGNDPNVMYKRMA